MGRSNKKTRATIQSKSIEIRQWLGKQNDGVQHVFSVLDIDKLAEHMLSYEEHEFIFILARQLMPVELRQLRLYAALPPLLDFPV